MSSSIQYKLLNLEIAPPEGVWQKIAEELDESASGFRFPEKLRQLAVTPPAGTWEKITTQLDEELVTGTVSEKLYAAEILPPAAAWNKIKTTLDTEHATRRRISPLLKYAAAAGIIGLLAFGAMQLIRPGTKNTGTVSANGSIPAIEAINHANAGLDAANDNEGRVVNTDADDQEAREDAALEASKKTYAKLEMTPAKKADIASAFRFSSYINPDDINEHSSSGYEEALSQDDIKASRYIVLMTPDGHFIRMSKKLSNLVCCVSGEEQDKNCRTQVDKWRKQLACSDASHPGNFMDILSLVGSLQDN